MSTQTNLLGYFDKVISRKRKLQSNITSFFNKKTDKDGKEDDVIYVGDGEGMYFFRCFRSRNEK